MIAERLAELHARTMTVPWTVGDFEELLSGKGVFVVSSSLPKFACESARGAAPLSPIATPEGAQPLIGLAMGSVVLEEAELLTLAVDPDVRRQGIGRACLEAFEAEAARRGAAVLHLEVAETNVPAIALYLSAGWERSGQRKAYYATPDGRVDAVLMTKRLSVG